MFDNYNSLEDMIRTAAAESIQQIKDRLVNSQKPMFTEDEFNTLLSLDPTYAGGEKVGAYTLWLIKAAKKDKKIIGEDSYKTKEYLEIFNQIKNRLPQDKKRIESYSSIQDLLSVVEPYRSGEEDLQSEGQSKRELYTEKGEINTVYKDDDWLIVSPLTMGAACYWGSGTEWCTATRNKARNQFDHYNSQGSIFIIIYKDGTKWQLHRESRQLADVTDTMVPVTDLLEGRYTSVDFLKCLYSLAGIELPDETEKEMVFDLVKWIDDNYCRDPEYYCVQPLYYGEIRDLLRYNDCDYVNFEYDSSSFDFDLIDESNEDTIKSILVNNYNAVLDDIFYYDYLNDTKNDCTDIWDAIINAHNNALSDAMTKYVKTLVFNEIERYTGGTISNNTLTIKTETDGDFYKKYLEIKTSKIFTGDVEKTFCIEGEGIPYIVGCDFSYFNECLKSELSKIVVLTDTYKEHQEGQQFLFNESGEPTVSFASFINIEDLVKSC